MCGPMRATTKRRQRLRLDSRGWWYFGWNPEASGAAWMGPYRDAVEAYMAARSFSV